MSWATDQPDPYSLAGLRQLAAAISETIGTRVEIRDDLSIQVPGAGVSVSSSPDPRAAHYILFGMQAGANVARNLQR